MDIKVVDTTLRDGEQKAGIALGINEKIQIAKKLNCLGIYQIEAGIPAMGGSERKSIQKIVELGLKSKISAWNRMNVEDIKQSAECKVEIVHISVPSSDIQIVSKLCRDRVWVIDNLKRCIDFARTKEFEVTIGLEDASRADFNFLLELIGEAGGEGVRRVRYADTVGIMHRHRMYEEIKAIKKVYNNMEIELHTHNDLGMAVANAVSGVKAGAGFVDCTIGGIGERAGNCNYLQFIQSAEDCLDTSGDIDVESITAIQNEILRIIKGH